MVTHDAGAPTTTVGGSADQAENHSHRVFLLMFDEEHLANESLMRVKKAAEEFIQRQLAPGDVAGVFTGGALYKGRLTSDKIELLAGVRSVKPAFDNRATAARGLPRVPTNPG